MYGILVLRQTSSYEAIVKHLRLVSAKRNIKVLMQHIHGLSTVAANVLSRSQVNTFHQVYANALPNPTQKDLMVFTLLY